MYYSMQLWIVVSIADSAKWWSVDRIGWAQRVG